MLEEAINIAEHALDIQEDVQLIPTRDNNLFFGLPREKMSGKYIIGSLVATGVAAYVLDVMFSDKKILGGTTPRTVIGNEWWEETDKKFQAWPRTAGPPVVMNPITRQNFIVKTSSDSE